jgi:ubiquinone/menaquinone biosynthesis C-methylase UbiE
MSETIPQPEIIDGLEMAVHSSFALLAGMKLDLFTPLKDAHLSVEEIAQVSNLKPNKLKPLLYALVAAGLLAVEDDRFTNSPEADHYLVRGRPAYLGDRHKLWSWLWNAELQTAETIRSGVPQAKYDFTAMSEAELENFYRGTIAGAARSGRTLTEQFDFSRYNTLVDVAGGSGGLSIAVAEACPGLSATVVDLPTVTPFTRKFVAEAEASGRVSVMSRDIIQQPITGSYDVAVLRAVIQVLSAEDARQTINNVAKVVKPGGSIYILGSVLDNTRLSPLNQVTYNLVFINVYDEGQAYTEQEHKEWLIEAGFAKFERVTLPDGSQLICAQKPT